MTKPMLPILNAGLAILPRAELPLVLARRGSIIARVAATPEDRRALYHLRAERFLGQGDRAEERDAFDAFATHIVIEDLTPGAAQILVGGYRAFYWPVGSELEAGYTGQVYGLERLAAMRGAKLEIGRLCMSEAAQNPDISRVLMASVAQLARRTDAVFLFGCSSFARADPALHAAALHYAFTHHAAPEAWMPAPRAARIVPADAPVLMKAAPSPHGLPPMLRQILRQGGRVSSHAVIDTDLDTLHVFAGLPLWKVPRAYREHLLQF